MSKSILTDLNLNQNEAQNLVMQNLAAAPATPKAGQHYFNTVDNTEYVWNGTAWVDALNIGEVLTFTAPLVKTGTTVSANIDTVVGTNSNYLVTSGAVKTAIDTAVTGALIYQGSWTATGQTDYSNITLPVKKGYMYAVSGSATIGGVEWNSGDYLVINKDIAVGGTITSADVDKIDNTEGSDIVRLNATQTLTNKTIDADDNTIQDLATSNFKSGVIVTSVGSTGADTSIPTEKAVRSAISTATTDMAKVMRWANGTALTPSSGVCTWTISTGITDSTLYPMNVSVYDISTNEEVMCDVSFNSTAGTIIIKVNSASEISIGSYVAVIVY